MEPETFDALVRRAAGLLSRRWMIGAAASTFPLLFAAPQLDADAKKNHHSRHDRVNEEKKKKKKRRKKTPNTPPVSPPPTPPGPPTSPPPVCRALHQTCSRTCCQSLGCGDNGCDPGSVCYQLQGGACTDSCDCHVDNLCSDRHGNTCQNCAVPQEDCAADAECCFNSSTCGDNGCDSNPVCCQGQGERCFEGCDCCAAFECSDRQDFTCQDCAATQEVCATDEDCCFLAQTCGHNPCDGGESICCGTPGAFCTEACDCCGDHAGCGDNGCSLFPSCFQNEGGSCEFHCDCRADLNCSERQGSTCQTCGLPQDSCTTDDDCCLSRSNCVDDGSGSNVCCQPQDALCFVDSDCCDPFVCDTELNQCVETTEMSASGMTTVSDGESSSKKAKWSRSGSTSVDRTAAVAPASPALIKQRSRNRGDVGQTSLGRTQPRKRGGQKRTGH